MHEQEQFWVLICLRSMEGRPSEADLRARFGQRVFWALSDVHPLDAEQLLEPVGDGLVLTLSEAIIDLFAPASAAEVRERLWFADPEGRLRQITAAQAGAFWQAWEVGVMHVSEILLAHGLWR